MKIRHAGRLAPRCHTFKEEPTVRKALTVATSPVALSRVVSNDSFLFYNPTRAFRRLGVNEEVQITEFPPRVETDTRASI